MFLLHRTPPSLLLRHVSLYRGEFPWPETCLSLPDHWLNSKQLLTCSHSEPHRGRRVSLFCLKSYRSQFKFQKPNKIACGQITLFISWKIQINYSCMHSFNNLLSSYWSLVWWLEQGFLWPSSSPHLSACAEFGGERLEMLQGRCGRKKRLTMRHGHHQYGNE